MILGVRVRPCEGGWYWEAFRGGVKVNGGIAATQAAARHLGAAHVRTDRVNPRGTW